MIGRWNLEKKTSHKSTQPKLTDESNFEMINLLLLIYNYLIVLISCCPQES